MWAVSSLNNLTTRAGSVQLIHLNHEETVERLRIKKIKNTPDGIEQGLKDK